jgi:putative membrane protein
MFHKKRTQQELDVDVRFLLANERTLLAWIRTGLAIIAGGIAISFVATNTAFGTFTGLGAIIFGGLLALMGYSRYRIADKAIRCGELPGTGPGGMIVVAGVVFFAGTLVVIRSVHGI